MSMAIKYGMQKKAKGGMMCSHGSGPDCPTCKADGGEVEPHPTSTATIDQDKADKAAKSMRDAFHFADGGVVDRIMKARKGESADEHPNDFENPIDVPDDADYTAENSGDNLGNEALDENDADLIRRIMRSRAKKDSNPRPA